MIEREISFDTHRPILSKGYTPPLEPNVTRFLTMTPENEKKSVLNIPVKIGDINFPMPTVLLEDNLPVTDIIFEVKDDIEKLNMPYGDLPIGGMEQRTFKSAITGKAEHLSLTLPASIEVFEQDLIWKRISSLVEVDRKDEVDYLSKNLPKAHYFEDKGLVFNIAGVTLLTLTQYGPSVDKDLRDEKTKIKYNFFENRQNQELLPYEDGFKLEYTIEQSDDPFIDDNGVEKDGLITAGIKFPKSVDFNYINTYLKTYTKNGGKLTEELVRENLFSPYYSVVLKDRKENKFE